MSFCFFYSFALDAKLDSENLKKILDFSSQCGYSFYVVSDDGKRVTLDNESAAKFLVNEHPLIKNHIGIELFKHGKYETDFDIDKMEKKKLSLHSLRYVEDYKDVISYIPKVMGIFRPFKISYFEMFEEYFLDMPFPPQDHTGPIIWGNLAQTWPMLRERIVGCGFKILDEHRQNEIKDIETGENEHDYRFMAYLVSDETVIKAEISGADVCLMPLKPYREYEYENGKDIDTAYYLDLYYKLAQGALVLDMVEAKNF